MLRRLLIVAAGLVASIAVGLQPASADQSPVTSPIQAGNNAQTIGSATFTRTADSSGNETLTVDLSVQGGIAEDHLCLSDTAYTSRVSPGQCAYAHQGLNGATTDEFVVDLGSTYFGKTVYAQLHVATTDGQTAYAGWQAGNPFYGNVAIDAVAEGVPSAPLLGSWLPVGLAALFFGGAGAVVWRRRLS